MCFVFQLIFSSWGDNFNFPIHSKTYFMGYTYGFKKLTVWQMNRQFAKKRYFKTKPFPKEELFGITSQIKCAYTLYPAI